MIRSEAEYQQTLRLIAEQKRHLDEQQKCLASMNLTRQEVKRAMDPLLSFHEQLKDEVESYERLKRGELDEIH